VAKAARFLGLPYHLRGIVQHGDKRGRTLGFPTANIVPDNALVGFAPRQTVKEGRGGKRHD